MKKIFDFISTVLMMVIIFVVGKIVYQNILLEQTSVSENIIQENMIANIVNGKYYYQQLSNEGKIIYEYIDLNKENMKTGNYVIEIDNKELCDKLKEEDGQSVVTEAFNSAWVAYTYDNPEIFYLDVNKMNLIIEYKKSLIKTNYMLKMQGEDNESYLQEFSSGESVNEIISKVEAKKKSILANISGSQYKQVKQVHDWLINNVEYDQTESINQYDLYGALINGKAVCEGYAEAFKYLLDDLGIENVIVSGIAINSSGKKDLHAWNYVKLNDKWYGIDLTWDDPIVVGGGSLSEKDKYEYFLKGKSFFQKNHITDGQLSENGMKFTFPELSETNYN